MDTVHWFFFPQLISVLHAEAERGHVMHINQALGTEEMTLKVS